MKNKCPAFPRLPQTAGIAIVLAFAHPAFAATEIPDEQEIALEEIVVTASKRRQALQELALAVSAYSGDAVETFRIADVMDLGLYAPNLVVSNNGGAGRLYIRGVGNSLDFLGSQSAVALHRDGVYQSRPWGVFYEFLDVDRIEVLRGPQGTIYGRNSSGGAINIVSVAPTEELTAKATVSAGNYNALKYAGTISSALSANLDGRLAVSRSSRYGYSENLYPGSPDLDDDDLMRARGELRYASSDAFEVRLMGHYLSRNNAGPAVVPTTDGLAAAMGARSNTNPFEVSHNISTFLHARNKGVTAIAAWEIRDWLTLESTTAYEDNSVSSHLDSDGTELDVVSFRNEESHSQFSQELRILGSSDDSDFEWQAGLFYIGESTDNSGEILTPPNNQSILVAAGIEGDAAAVYLQGTYPLIQNWALTAGVRYNTETKRLSKAPAVRDKTTWTDWTPHLSLQFQPNERSLFYASITKGFKSGGYNALGDGRAVDPEKIWSYEVGSKTEFANRRVRLNSAFFVARYKDQQVNSFLGTGIVSIANAAKSTIHGLELELFAAPARDLSVAMTFSYLDATFDTYIAADPFLGAVDLADSRMSNAPKFSYSLMADYTIATTQQSSISIHADYLWQDDTKYDVFDDASTAQQSYGILNGSIFYTSKDERWKVGIWGRNLTDKTYFTSHTKLNFSPTGVVSWTGRPRTYGVEFSWTY